MNGEELSKEVRAMGFPIEHKHKLCCLRQELIDSFVESRYMMFIKYAAYHLQQLNLRKTNEKKKKEEKRPAIDDNKKEEEKEENSKDEATEKDDKNKEEIEDAEAKKIVESITDGSKMECKNCCEPQKISELCRFCFSGGKYEKYRQDCIDSSWIS